MQKVGAYTERATAEGEWRPGNPSTGQQATPMLAAWFNMVQRELVGVVEGGGQALDINDDGQLLAALQALGLGGYASAAEAQALASLTKILTPGTLEEAFKGGNQDLQLASGFQNFPGGLILQWKRVFLDGPLGESSQGPDQNVDHRHPYVGYSVNFPFAFPTGVLFADAKAGSIGTPTGSESQENVTTTSNFDDDLINFRISRITGSAGVGNAPEPIEVTVWAWGY